MESQVSEASIRKYNLIKMAKWAEPIGQIAVLAAVGIQLFGVGGINFASTAMERRRQLDLSEHIAFDISLIMSKIGVQLDKQDQSTIDAAQSYHVNKSSADAIAVVIDSKGRLYNNIYATMFIVGSILIIIGKSASVASSSK